MFLLKKQESKYPFKVTFGNTYLIPTLLNASPESYYQFIAQNNSVKEIFDPNIKHVIIPVHINQSHWLCVRINKEMKRIEFYDSGKNNVSLYTHLHLILEKFMKEGTFFHCTKSIDAYKWVLCL